MLVAGCTSRRIVSTPTTTDRGFTAADSPFAHEARVLEARPTAERPPIVEISVRNADDRPHSLSTANYSFPFTTRTGHAVDGDEGMLLTPNVPSTRDGSCWRDTPRLMPAFNGRAFAPGESVSARYAVQNHEDAAVCWPAGTYEFPQEYHLDPESPNTGQGGTEYTWRLVLTVTDEPAVTVEG